MLTRDNIMIMNLKALTDGVTVLLQEYTTQLDKKNEVMQIVESIARIIEFSFTDFLYLLISFIGREELMFFGIEAFVWVIIEIPLIALASNPEMAPD